MYPDVAGAQAKDRGALTGNVTDGQGTPIAEAGVLVRNVATGSTRATLTVADGTFTVGELWYGVYQIRVTREGFSDAVVEVRLTAPGATLDPIRLALGTIREYDIFNLVPPGTAGINGVESLRHANLAVTGSGGIVVNPIPAVVLVARVARSYREPNIFDRYNAGASHTISPTTRSVTIPNPDLRPETGINLDLGAKVRFTRFSGAFTCFRNNYTNFIGNFGAPVPGLAPIPNPIPGGVPLAVLQRQSLGRIRMQGIEAEFEAPFRLPDALRSSFVTLLGNLSVTRGDDLQANQPVDPFNFPVVPVKAVLGTRWNSATNRYYRSRIVTTQRRLPPGSLYAQPGTARLGFTVHDVRGGINFDRERYGVALTLGVENLVNRFYQDLFSLFDAPARGACFRRRGAVVVLLEPTSPEAGHFGSMLLMDIESLFRLPEDPDQIPLPVRMWLCLECGNFHLAIGGAHYTFSPEQFRHFVRSVNGCAVH